MNFLRRWSKPTIIERCFVAALAVLCLVLTALQYRWTAEISRRTLESLQAGYSDQAALFCQSFDADLTNACNALVPYEGEIDAANRAAVYVEHLRRWTAGPHRPMFRRLAVAVAENGHPQLLTLDQRVPRVTPAAGWPPEWNALHENLSRKVSGDDSGPFQEPSGMLLEFPIRDRNGNISEWIILELDPGYLSKVWLPELVSTYLNREGHAVSDVRVQTAADPAHVIFSLGADPTDDPAPGGKAVSLRFNNRGRDDGGAPRRGMDDGPSTGGDGPPHDGHGPPHGGDDGPPPDDGHGPPGDGPGPSHDGPGPQPGGARGRWRLVTRQHTGALEAAVASARWHSFALTGLLTGLTLAAGLALVHYTRRSRKLSEAQMQFVASVSHELRTPLTVIRGAGHNLLRGIAREPAQIEQYSRLILQHADQLSGMVEQVLELAAGRRKDNASMHRPIALADVLAEALAATAPAALAAGCRVQTEIRPDLPAVSGDAPALRRVFENLLANAAKHAGRGRWIGVFTDVLNGDAPPTVEVRVSDHGPGIPRDEQARVFESFFRGSTARAQQIRGSGLGLSVVREIVEAHRGSVFVRSDGERGATFTVRLPVAPAANTP